MTGDGAPLAGMRILVVEDEAFVALMACDWLAEAGAEPLGPAASVAQALDRLAGEGRIDAALLDVQLADGRSEPVAARLRELGVPFVVATGYDSPRDPVYDRAPRLEKPYLERDLAGALQQAMAGRHSSDS